MPLCTRRRSTAATACCWRRTMLHLRGSDREPFFGGLHAEVLARFTDQSRLPANQDSRSEFFGPGKSFCGSLGQRKYSVRIRSPAAILWVWVLPSYVASTVYSPLGSRARRIGPGDCMASIAFRIYPIADITIASGLAKAVHTRHTSATAEIWFDIDQQPGGSGGLALTPASRRAKRSQGARPFRDDATHPSRR
jgi:hypothetical protein